MVKPETQELINTVIKVISDIGFKQTPEFIQFPNEQKFILNNEDLVRLPEGLCGKTLEVTTSYYTRNGLKDASVKLYITTWKEHSGHAEFKTLIKNQSEKTVTKKVTEFLKHWEEV